MPSGLPARVVILCILLCGVPIAHAERRPVAVIDLSGEKASSELADGVYRALLAHPDLSPIPVPAVQAALFGEFVDDDVVRRKDAEASKATAERYLASFDFPGADAGAGNGQNSLHEAMPTAQLLVLYAQLTFLRGQAMLGRNKATQAREQFALAHRLDPGFVPDAARYLPDVVQAFNAAKVHWSGVGKLEVAGKGRLWIDGKDNGVAPAEIEVPAGPHVVWLTGGDRDTKAGFAVVEAGTKKKLEIADADASKETKVRRARATLRYAPDPTARASAIQHIAALVGVKDVVLLTSANNKIIVQTWNDGTRKDVKPGFSALEEVKKKTPIDLLQPLAPPPKKQDTPPETGPKELVDTRKWYQKRPYQAGMVAGAVATAIGIYLLYGILTDNTVTASGDLGPAEARMRF